MVVIIPEYNNVVAIVLRSIQYTESLSVGNTSLSFPDFLGFRILIRKRSSGT